MVRDSADTTVYSYDANGNRIQVVSPLGTVTGTYDGEDRLQTYGGADYTYNNAGQLTQKDQGGQVTSYTYDVLGNLTAVTLPDSTQISYLVDGQGRRIGKKVNGVLVQGWLWQGQLAPVAELDGSGQVVSRFVYGTRVNVPDYMERGGATYRLVTNHLGSVELVVNASTGEVASWRDYDAWGRVVADSNPDFQPFGFAGGIQSQDVALVHFGARDYDPHTGRWLTPDPIGFAGGDANLFSYVGDDPVNRTDPLGQDWLTIAANFSAGFGDIISLGLTKDFRELFGYDNVIDYCGGIYGLGEAAGIGTSLLLGGASAAENALRMGGARGDILKRLGRGLGRFIVDNRTFPTVSEQYWRGRGAGGMHLHHWFLPKRVKPINAGWNLFAIPGTLNSFMNGTGLLAHAAEWGIKLGVPSFVAGWAAQGASYGSERDSRCQCE